MGSIRPPHWHGMYDLGRMARRAGADFFETPMLSREPMGGTNEALDRWAGDGNAWSAGWIDEDAGRTERIQRMVCLQVW